MNSLADMAIAIKDLQSINSFISKIKGKRNYCIHTETDPETGKTTAYVGTLKAIKDHGYNGASIQDAVAYSMHWYYYTYKSDFDFVIQVLNDCGCKVRWVG